MLFWSSVPLFFRRGDFSVFYIRTGSSVTKRVNTNILLNSFCAKSQIIFSSTEPLKERMNNGAKAQQPPKQLQLDGVALVLPARSRRCCAPLGVAGASTFYFLVDSSQSKSSSNLPLPLSTMLPWLSPPTSPSFLTAHCVMFLPAI